MQTAIDIDFQRLTPEQFEELCFDLLLNHDFRKLSWRRGGGDGGRDIQGVRGVATGIVDPFEETWFFECKRYATGVPPEELNSKIAWADAERPQHLVLFVSSYLTNAAREWLEKIAPTKGYRIHVLEGKPLQMLVARFPTLVARYFASDIQRLMQDAHRTWLFHNLVPEPGTLRRLGDPDYVDSFDVGQIAFLWASLKLRTTGMMKEWDSSAPEYYGHLFIVLQQHATTNASVLAGGTEWALIETVEEHNHWEIAYPHVFAAQVAHIVDKVERIALYCLVRDSDGEGLEVLVDQDSSLTYAIRHIPLGAKAAVAEAKRILKV